MGRAKRGNFIFNLSVSLLYEFCIEQFDLLSYIF